MLAALLRFYASDSWPVWGLVSLSPEDESDVEEPLVVHETLDIATIWAPEIAVQELARYVGLDYDKVMINVKEYEKVQEKRAAYAKRTVADDPIPSKRGRLETVDPQTARTKEADTARSKLPSSDVLSGELGWDTRRTEERTPESRRARIRDA
ncbi:hypothetical protein BDY17DRAFT_314231 [Neohortaea acidophila]|uniref:Uncharacterized protein n=1 Tax=Neohortaea acidophila TaxID=245834 RepID=A0A6A6PEU2_9PEZI|nr:uncharacterized protein BDY17DRAFT_314231 [Neohortaea acidophila]KAF2478440.1 hypothetical protein BDY17DRAFT_314231 [Neohortaea acidophila]